MVISRGSATEHRFIMDIIQEKLQKKNSNILTISSMLRIRYMSI